MNNKTRIVEIINTLHIMESNLDNMKDEIMYMESAINRINKEIETIKKEETNQNE